MTDIPKAFICPITLTIMSDPYSDIDGITYEKEAIIMWITHNNTSPVTRNPMSIASLTPNRALKDAIENYLGKTNSVEIPVATLTDINTNDRDELDIIVVADVSGSMQETCSNGNSTEFVPYTRLDLVKHAIRAITLSLTPKDKLALIKFNNVANKLTGLLHVNDVNKQIFNDTIDSLYADGGTNIWDALRVAIDLAKTNNNKTHILLFTDGVANVHPPRGIIPTLKDYLCKNDSNITINTYGFGNNINSSSLFEISQIKDGIFGFIPDSSMIGTVFINSVAHLMTYNKVESIMSDIEKIICNKVIEALQTKTLNDFNEYLRTNYNGNSFVNDILIDSLPSTNDSMGQINKAFEPRYYSIWGEHYIYSVISAYWNKLCLNFRDHGVQHFKTELFEKYQKIIEDIFVNMEPPNPTGYAPSYSNYTGAQLTSQQFSQTFYNSNGVCFTGDTLIRNVNGEFIKVEDVKKGTQLSSLGKVMNVICVLKTKYNPGTIRQYINFPSTCITQYHPVFFDNFNWVFPIDSDKFCEKNIQEHTYVYDFILDVNHVVELGGGVFATTLNHGQTGDIIGHDYFGTDKIQNDLMKHSGWDNGYIQLDDYKYVRNDIDNRICKIVF